MARAASFPAKWTCRSYNNWRMQDDASVPENQDATSGTLEHALGEARPRCRFRFRRGTSLPKNRAVRDQVGQAKQEESSYPAREDASRRNTQFH